MANQNDFRPCIMTDQAKTALAGAAGGVVRWVTARALAGCRLPRLRTTQNSQIPLERVMPNWVHTRQR